MKGKLPRRNPKALRSLDHVLSIWLSKQTTNGMLGNANRRLMLEWVHPLVDQLVAGWDASEHKARKVAFFVA